MLLSVIYTLIKITKIPLTSLLKTRSFTFFFFWLDYRKSIIMVFTLVGLKHRILVKLLSLKHENDSFKREYWDQVFRQQRTFVCPLDCVYTHKYPQLQSTIMHRSSNEELLQLNNSGIALKDDMSSEVSKE